MMGVQSHTDARREESVHLGPVPGGVLFRGEADRKCQRLARNRDIFSEGDDIRAVLVLREGWAYRYKLLSDGRRYILGFLLPGDVISPYTRRASHFAATMTDVVIEAIIPSAAHASSPATLAFEGAVTRALVQEHEMLAEHAVSLARRNAMERMSVLLVEICERVSDDGPADGQRFDFPATQEIIADALGLSVVHVNRTIRRLREAKIASVDGGHVTVLDAGRLRRLALSETLETAA